MTESTRREFLQVSLAAAAAASMTATRETLAMESDMQQAFGYVHQPKPLSFDAKSLNGLSERLIVSHWENNYGGAVKALNIMRERLRAAAASDESPYVYNDLKREHSMRTGSVVLHELYFDNLGGDGAASADSRSAIARSFGSFDAWEGEFRRIGQGLGGGSGWVVLGYNEHLKLLENYCLADHASNPPWTRPVLVMDMYEHSYHMDFGAAAPKYIDAFMANVQWERVSERMSNLAV